MAAPKRSTRVVDIPAVSSVEEKDKTESESESEEEGSTPPPIPPISTSSVSQGSKNIHSPTASSASKRLADPQENGDPKKTKVLESVTVKDEIAMLKGMIDYVANKGEDPFADLAGFHDFIKESSSVDVSNDQLTDKIKSLKNKYQNNVELQTQPETVLARPLEKMLFHLSKEIWGKADSPVSQQQNGSGSGSGFMTHLEIPTSLEISDDAMKILNKNMGLLGDAKAKELEEKEMDLNVAVLELYSKRLALIRERTSMVIDAMKASMS